MPPWNPLLASISGRLAERSRLRVHIAPPGKSGMTFTPTLLAIRPAHELRWRVFDKLVAPKRKEFVIAGSAGASQIERNQDPIVRGH
jgi:hypothetical protein